MILRRKGPLLINLFVMMLSAGLPELRSLEDIDYLRKTLALSLSEEDAIKDFNKKLEYAIKNSYFTAIDWFWHNAKQKDPKNARKSATDQPQQKAEKVTGPPF